MVLRHMMFNTDDGVKSAREINVFFSRYFSQKKNYTSWNYLRLICVNIVGFRYVNEKSSRSKIWLSNLFFLYFRLRNASWETFRNTCFKISSVLTLHSTYNTLRNFIMMTYAVGYFVSFDIDVNLCVYRDVVCQATRHDAQVSDISSSSTGDFFADDGMVFVTVNSCSLGLQSI